MANTHRIKNCAPSRDTHRDWLLSHVDSSGLVAAPGPIPAKKDLREDWWRINNQHDTGSCVGWATADSVLRWHFVKENRLRTDELLSPRFLWMSAKETDEYVSYPSTFLEIDGTSLKAALDIARKYGAVKDSVLPFESGKLFKGPVQAFFATAAQRKIMGYVNLGRDLVSWRRWIATRGPILTRLECDDTFMNAKATHGKLDKYLASTADGGHAVALVGYTEDTFIVRNSWGTDDWGDKGFAYASDAYAKEAFVEAYGVIV